MTRTGVGLFAVETGSLDNLTIVVQVSQTSSPILLCMSHSHAIVHDFYATVMSQYHHISHIPIPVPPGLLTHSPLTSSQMRSAGVEGYGPWSDPIILPIMSPPPPRNITAEIDGVPSVDQIDNEMMVRVSGEVVLEWSPPDDPTEGGVTRYESRVGLEALSPFQNPPMGELNSFEVRVGTHNVCCHLQNRIGLCYIYWLLSELRPDSYWVSMSEPHTSAYNFKFCLYGTYGHMYTHTSDYTEHA